MVSLNDVRLPDSFWSKVIPEPNTGCWLWIGATTTCGYGKIYRFADGIRTSWLAHRQMAAVVHGVEMWRLGECVCHRCDQPCCVNPDHLFVGTHGDNAADKARKGRAFRPRGERHHNARLTVPLVRMMRDEHATGLVTQIELARKYGVRPAQVSRIIRREQWV